MRNLQDVAPFTTGDQTPTDAAGCVEDAAGTYVVHAVVDERVEIPDSRLLGHIERGSA